MLLVKKCHFFSLLRFGQKKKKTLFDCNKKNFSKSKQKVAFFSKGLTDTFGQKMPFFLYLDLIKMRLKIMLSDFAGKKGTFFGIKKKEFFKVQKIALF